MTDREKQVWAALTIQVRLDNKPHHRLVAKLVQRTGLSREVVVSTLERIGADKIASCLPVWSKSPEVPTKAEKHAEKDGSGKEVPTEEGL